MNAHVYRRPELNGSATLVIDFRAEEKPELAEVKSTFRRTSSSRGKGHNEGLVFSRIVPRKRCLDCGGIVDGRLEDGKHAVHGRDGGRVNCAGRSVT